MWSGETLESGNLHDSGGWGRVADQGRSRLQRWVQSSVFSVYELRQGVMIAIS